MTTSHSQHAHQASGTSLTRQAVSATLHCLTGCAIGEVLGMVLGTWWGWSNGATIALAIVLAFLFGYSLTVGPCCGPGSPCDGRSGSRWPPTPSRSW